MSDVNDLFATGMEFHGHKCPAMPLGLRAGLAAMRVLEVKRARDKELMLYSETGKGHAAGCFVDGLMMATGCTYGKANIQKLYYNKMAFTLIDVVAGKSVRVSLQPTFFAQALQSPFVQQRRAGVPPQEIAPELTNPIVDRILSLPESEFLNIGDVEPRIIDHAKGLFDAKPCASCGELVFINKLRLSVGGEFLCIPCSGYGS